MTQLLLSCNLGTMSVGLRALVPVPQTKWTMEAPYLKSMGSRHPLAFSPCILSHVAAFTFANCASLLYFVAGRRQLIPHLSTHVCLTTTSSLDVPTSSIRLSSHCIGFWSHSVSPAPSHPLSHMACIPHLVSPFHCVPPSALLRLSTECRLQRQG